MSKISQYVSELNVPLNDPNIRLDWSHNTDGVGAWVTKYMRGSTFMGLINSGIETFYTIDGAFDEDRTITSAGFDWFHTGTGKIAFGAADALGYKLRIVGGAGQEALRVDTESDVNVLTVTDDGANGFVGIGTAAPSIKLEVVGDASVSGNFGIGTNPLVKFHILTTNPVNEPFIFQAATAGADGANIFFYKHRGTATVPTATLLNDKLGRLGWQSYGTSQKNVASVQAQATENHTVTNLGTKLFWDTTTNTTAVLSTKMTLDHNGNLGVGTTAPSEKVHAVGNVRASDAMIGSPAASNAYFGYFSNLTTSGYSIRQQSNGTTHINTKAGQVIRFNVDNGVAKMTMTSAGDFGIGTGAPSQKVHAVGNIQATEAIIGSPAANNAYFGHTSNFNVTDYAIRQESNGTTHINAKAGQLIRFNINNGVASATITATGDLGVGTAAPNEKLEVVGNVRTSGHYKVGAIQVVGAQGAAVIDATDAASAITQLNALLARARAHGLIA